MKKTNERGITLVMLILTIIIMLILLGAAVKVVIDVSFTDEARTLVKDMEKQDTDMSETKNEVRNQIELGVIEKSIIVTVNNITETSATITTNNNYDSTETFQYNLYINGKKYGSNTTGNWDVTELTAGTTYEYRVLVVSGENNIIKTGSFTTSVAEDAT